MDLPYSRILLKLSGESLAGDSKKGIDPDILTATAREVRAAVDLGIQVGVVVGAGNIFRGLSSIAKDMDRTRADHMGMLGTVINSLALGDAFERAGLETRVVSSLAVPGVAEDFVQKRAVAQLARGRTVIFAGGTGNPYFTTDTAAALKACEVGADVLVKATRVDGVYSADPEKDSTATRFSSITYDDVLRRDLRVMDSTAFALCRDNRIPIVVFRMGEGRLVQLLKGQTIGTVVNDIEGG